MEEASFPYTTDIFLSSIPVPATQVGLLTSDRNVSCRPLEPS